MDRVTGMFWEGTGTVGTCVSHIVGIDLRRSIGQWFPKFCNWKFP